METIEIQTVDRPIVGSIRPPGSKSLTNRALAAAALADGSSLLTGALDSEDTRVMIAGLRQLGIGVDVADGGEAIRVTGCGGVIPAKQADVFVENSGTTIRFLTALVALGHGEYQLDGTGRMRERPINDLLTGLRQLGVDAISVHGNGCPPVLVRAAGLRGGRATVHGNVSSQFLSGLLLAAPYAQTPVELAVDGVLVSQPYVRMTLAVMSAFGLHVDAGDLSHFSIPTAKYRATDYAIEPDASAASYFFGAAAITGGSITVRSLGRDSLQGDIDFCDCLASMGCRVEYRPAATTVTGGPLCGVDLDMNAISDTVQTLGVVALFADGPTTIRNVAHIRHKETDRLAALATELRKLGGEIQEAPDGLTITPRSLHGAEIATYNDHRMAMSFALAGLRIPGVVIQNPRCAEKTYPQFFVDLERLCAK